MTTAIKMPQPRTRWRLRAGVLGILLLAAFGAAVYVYLCVASVSLMEAEAEADRSDPDWRLDAMLARRRVIPNAENSASQVNAVLGDGLGVLTEALPNYERIFNNLTSPAQLNSQQERLIRTKLVRYPRGIDEARKLREMPYGGFAVNGDSDFLSMATINHLNLRAVADLLKHDAYLLAHENHTDLALESCQALFNTGRSMGDDPFLLSHQLRVDIQKKGVAAAERVLAQGEAADETLANLQTLLAKEIAESTWRHGARGDRAGSHFLFECLRKGDVNLRHVRSVTGMKSAGPASDWVHDALPLTVQKHLPEHLQFLNRAVEISKLPLHQQRKPLEELIDQAEKSRNVISSNFSTKYAKIYEADCRSQALLRSAWAALACERYRLKHERWPASLDALVEGRFLDAVPLDPHNGRALRMTRTKDGVTICAVGPDGDVGFRLWDVDRRRQAPLPIVALPEKGM